MQRCEDPHCIVIASDAVSEQQLAPGRPLALLTACKCAVAAPQRDRAGLHLEQQQRAARTLYLPRVHGAMPLAASAASASIQPAAMAHCAAETAPVTAAVVSAVALMAVVLKPSPQKVHPDTSPPAAQ